MTMPSQTEIEIPLLEVLESLGGKGKPQQIYPLVTAKFPNLTQDELEEKIESGGNKWTNRIQWVRMKLIKKGDMHNPQRGLWAITEQGRRRLSAKNVTWEEAQRPTTNLIELYDTYEEEFKAQLLDKLYELTPRQFEEFSKKLLQAYGFINLFVTKVSKDGGIDGYGKLKIGLASMNVAFQCERFAVIKCLEPQGFSDIKKGLHPNLEKFSSDQTQKPQGWRKSLCIFSKNVCFPSKNY